MDLDQLIEDCKNLWTRNNAIQGNLFNDWNEQHRVKEELKQLEANKQTDDNANVEQLTNAKETIQQLDHCIQTGCVQLCAARAELISKISKGAELLQENMQQIINHFEWWKTNQKRAQIGAPFNGKDVEFKYIHTEFEKSFDYISELQKFANWLVTKLRECAVDTVQDESFIAKLNQIVIQLNEFYKILLKNILVIFEQSGPVMKTQRKMNTMELRFLAAEKLGIRDQLDNANIRVDIVTEEVAKQLSAGTISLNQVQTFGSISNQTEKAMLNTEQQMTVKFNNSKLLSVHRRLVITQKLAFLFRCSPITLVNFGEKHTISLWSLSLPVVVSVHTSQDCELYLQIFWHRAFGSVNYNVSENQDYSLAVAWPSLAQALINQFMHYTDASVPLTEISMEYVAQKMYGAAAFDDPSRQNTSVTFQRFAEEAMSDEVDFSCWQWFFEIMHLVKQKGVIEFWDKGWLIGFISKREAADRIDAIAEPTLLLRFSDRVLGAISITYLKIIAPRERIVVPLQPSNVVDLHKMSLAERIRQLPGIRFLYPNIEIEHVLQQFPQEENSTSAEPPLGYRKSEIVMVVSSSAAINHDSAAIYQQLNADESNPHTHTAVSAFSDLRFMNIDNLFGVDLEVMQ